MKLPAIIAHDTPTIMDGGERGAVILVDGANREHFRDELSWVDFSPMIIAFVVAVVLIIMVEKNR